jgi:starch phosphorylase
MNRAVARFTITPALPDALAGLARLARNLAWTWDHELAALLRDVDPAEFAAAGGNPVTMLASVSPDRLDHLATDPAFVARLAAVEARLDARLAGASWYGGVADAPSLIAYFSPEFGVSEALPLYSGGLGVLAGDHLKACSDLGVRLVGVGLFYRQGYFRQRLTIAGAQAEEFVDRDPALLPLTRELGADGAPLEIAIDLPGTSMRAGVWRADIGRIALYLLDTDIASNGPDQRAVTDRLYGGDGEHRLRQEILLGIGGVKALAALGLEPEVFHTNEGHAGFLGVERIRRLVEGGLDPGAALEAVRAATVFTTHTPVPAGIDRFPRQLIERYFGDGGVPCGLPLDALLGLGEEPGGDRSVFNMAVMGLRMSAHVNGVSRLHGAVSRTMFHGVWPGLEEDEVPIGHITNGVHAESWVGPSFDRLYRERLGDGYGTDGDGFAALRDVGDEELWHARCSAREELVTDVRRRLGAQWSASGVRGAQLHWIREAFDPGALTIGFARRVPTYKRLTLVLRQRDRLVRLLTSADRPVQLVFAGKAHPHDGEGKALIEELGRFAASFDVRHRVVMLADYDMAMARTLVAGVDVWLNNPLRPFEACGTSGMKSALNGGLNCSILDGWWDELYDGRNGFAIPSAEDMTLTKDRRDEIEAAAILDLLEHEIIPRFYDRPHGLPDRWLEMVRHTITTLAPEVLASRMVRDYVAGLYVPAAAAGRRLAVEGHAVARTLGEWKAHVRDRWPGVSLADLAVDPTGLHAGDRVDVGVRARLDGLTPADVAVQVVYGRPRDDGGIAEPALADLTPVGDPVDGVTIFSGSVVLPAGALGITARIVPSHPDLDDPRELGLVATV